MQRIPSLASIASIVASIVSVAPVAPAILIALTALGHAGHASAQSTVTLYGLIDSGISYVDNGAAGATVRQQSGVSQGSRWGFLGSEDLGGGNKANIVLEGGFFNDTGVMTGNGGFSRRSIVGLFGAWGALDVGRDYNPVHTMLAQFDPLANGLLSASSGFMGNAGAQMPNAVFYATPDLDGVTAKVGYSFGERAGAGRSGDTLSSRVVYAHGRLAAGVAYAYQNVAAATGPSFTRDHQALLTLSYKFDVVEPVAMLQQGHNNSGSLVYNSNNGVPYSADFRTWMLGASVPLPGHKLAVTYQRYDDRTTANADAGNLALAWYAFVSRRTTLYANVAKIVNRNGQRFAFVDAGKNVYGYTPAAGERVNPVGVVIGIQHKF